MPISSNQITGPSDQNKQHLQRFESLRRATEDMVDHCPRTVWVSKMTDRIEEGTLLRRDCGVNRLSCHLGRGPFENGLHVMISVIHGSRLSNHVTWPVIRLKAT